jgi:hypothetical protein
VLLGKPGANAASPDHANVLCFEKASLASPIAEHPSLLPGVVEYVIVDNLDEISGQISMVGLFQEVVHAKIIILACKHQIR